MDGQGRPPHSWAVSPFRRDGFSHQSEDGPHRTGSAVYPQTSVSFLRVSFVYRLEGLVKRVRFNDDSRHGRLSGGRGYPWRGNVLVRTARVWARSALKNGGEN